MCHLLPLILSLEQWSFDQILCLLDLYDGVRLSQEHSISYMENNKMQSLWKYIFLAPPTPISLAPQLCPETPLKLVQLFVRIILVVSGIQ